MKRDFSSEGATKVHSSCLTAAIAQRIGYRLALWAVPHNTFAPSPPMRALSDVKTSSISQPKIRACSHHLHLADVHKFRCDADEPKDSNCGAQNMSKLASPPYRDGAPFGVTHSYDQIAINFHGSVLPPLPPSHRRTLLLPERPQQWHKVLNVTCRQGKLAGALGEHGISVLQPRDWEHEPKTLTQT